MTDRFDRRAVMAALLLTGSPRQISQMFDAASCKLSVEFDSIADLRGWLEATGLNTPELLAQESTSDGADGPTYRRMHAYPTFHGWKIYASAKEAVNTAPLDDATRDGLTALTGTGVPG